MLRFKCNSCHKLFEADVSLAGKVITCPDCRIWMFVPNPNIDESATGGEMADPHPNGEFAEAHEDSEFSEAHEDSEFSEARQGGEFAQTHSGAVIAGAAANKPVAATILTQSEQKSAGLDHSRKKSKKRGMTQRVIILAGLGCLTFMACFLPWVHIDNQGIEIETAGYHSIFTPPAATHYGVKVDLSRAVLPMALILCATVAAAYLTRERGLLQDSESSDSESEPMITRLQLCNPALPPKRQDAETWPN